MTGAITGARLIRIADLPPQPWKNGGGLTTEIAIHPAGATMDAFDWRISLARIDRDGPFSAFPGIDRWITLIEGGGFTLDFAGGSSITVAAPFRPQPFDGGTAAQCRLLAGPCRDLNVMARRGLGMQVDVIAAGHDAPPAGCALVHDGSALLRLDAALVLRAAL